LFCLHLISCFHIPANINLLIELGHSRAIQIHFNLSCSILEHPVCVSVALQETYQYVSVCFIVWARSRHLKVRRACPILLKLQPTEQQSVGPFSLYLSQHTLYYHSTLYIITAHCILSQHTVCYHSTLYIITAHCILSQHTVCYHSTLYIITAHSILSQHTVCYHSTLYIITAHCIFILKM